MNIYQFAKHLTERHKLSDTQNSMDQLFTHSRSKIFDKTNHITFTYLTDPLHVNVVDSSIDEYPATLLSLNLESSLGNFIAEKRNPNNIRVSLCLYRENEHRIFTNDEKTQSVNMEYLSYYMELSDRNTLHEQTPNGNKMFGFPSFTYNLNDYDVQEDGAEEADPFKEVCIDKIIELFSMEQIPRTSKKKSKRHKQYDDINVNFGYRGMVTHDNTLFVFFNMNTIEQFFRVSKSHFDKHPCIWAVVDEIIKTQCIFSIKIDTQIIELFMANPILWNISHEGKPIAFPRAMYSVVPSIDHNNNKDKTPRDKKEIELTLEPEYETVETPDYKTSAYSLSPSKKSRVSIPLLPFAYSDLFAERFLFTTKPIPSESAPYLENGLPGYKRYVVFVYHPKFIFSQKYKSHRKWLNDYPQNFVENMDPDDDDQVEEYRSIPCICFSQKLKHHSVTEFWGVIHDDLFAEVSPV